MRISKQWGIVNEIEVDQKQQQHIQNYEAKVN